MAKKHKNQTKHEQDKIVQAHLKNEFLAKLRKLCDDISGNPRIFSLIPHNDLEVLYKIRTLVPRFEPAPNMEIPAATMMRIKKMGSSLLKNKSIKILPDKDIEMSISDYFSLGNTLVCFIKYIEDSIFASSSTIKQALMPFKDYYDINEQAAEGLFRGIFFITLFFSHFSSRIYWLEFKTKKSQNGKLNMFFCFEANYFIPKKTMAVFKGEPRPAIQVCWAFKEQKFDFSKLKESEIDPHKPTSQLLLDVYIQSHAINRLLERIDCVEPGFLEFFIYNSLINPEIYHDKDGNILIAYYYYDVKIGYLLADIQKGLVVIRTFLFLTNNGTPEGEKLNGITGLNKLDHKYLNIDKLSSFMTSDIRSNQKVKDVFIEAGCGNLFELDKDSTYMTFYEDATSPAMILPKYLSDKKTGEPLLS